MGRNRKHGTNLPEHVHRTTRRGRTYYTFQKHRNTPRAGPRIRIPHEPDTAEFWKLYERLLESDAPRVDDWSVRALVRAYQASPDWQALKPESRRDYDRYLTIFDNRLGDFPAKAVLPPVLLELRDSFAATPVAANHMISVIKTLYAFGVPRGYAVANPAREIRPIRVRSEGSRPWPRWAIDLALGSARWEVRTFVALALYTGQRSKDVLAMGMASVKGDLIEVRQSKTDKMLKIPIHRGLAPVIDEARRAGRLFFITGPKGDPLDGDRWRALWGRELRDRKTRAGETIPTPLAPIREAGLTPHGLRKSAATTLRELGCSIEMIQSITGQSRQMVEYYCREYDQEAMARRTIRRWEDAE